MTVLQNPRLAPETFNLDVDKLRQGITTDKYFKRTRDILLKDKHHPKVLMQVFQKQHSVVAGLDEAIAILRAGAGLYDEAGEWHSGFDKLTVKALRDGNNIEPHEPVMTIEGDYTLFAHLETQYLGVIARSSMVATAVREVAVAAGAQYHKNGDLKREGKPILFFAARFDAPEVQARDGYAAMVGGATAVSTDEGASWLGGEGVGTMPHGLIAAYGGDTVLASQKYVEHEQKPVTPLVDWDNDCSVTAVKVANALGADLEGVRLDTSGTNVDEGVKRLVEQTEKLDHTWNWDNGFLSGQHSGVTVSLTELVREALDEAGHEHVKVVVSGGFNPSKIRQFEKEDAPVDIYGVGASLLSEPINFTADIVVVNDKPCAKVGRKLIPSERLELVA